MATKEKIKKKKNVPASKISPSSAKDEKDKIIEIHDESPGDVDNKSKASDEITKDVGREKERSDTPSPPPPVLKDDEIQKDSIISPYHKRRRSPSPFNQNKVEPLPSSSKDLSNPGSLVSLRSGASVKEAWSDAGGEEKRPESAQSKTSKKSLQVQKRNSQNAVDTISIKSMSREQHAYIPYLYARNCVAQITDDMKAMKEKHIRIVHDIEAHYRSLEGESQTQFMAFVLKYREKFAGRLESFRVLVAQHQDELNVKEQNWREENMSLEENNAKLLQEKNEALLQSKDQLEKMDKEKMALAGVSGVGAAEYKKLSEENQALKAELAILKEHGIEQSVPVEEQPTTVVEKEAVPLVAAIPVPLRGGDSDEDRKYWRDQVHKLQEEITELKRENGEITATNDYHRQQLATNTDLAARFALLENQYKALALLVVPNAETKAAAQEQLDKTKGDQIMMQDEQKRLEKEIKTWESNFRKKNGSEPTESDKSDSVKELYVQHAEVSQMVTALDQQKETLTKVTSGDVPPPAEAPATKASIQEPEVQVVEVKVPDPEVVTELEIKQGEIEDLKAQIAVLSVAGAAVAAGDGDTVDSEDLDAANAALLQERAAHDNTKAELENVQKQLELLNETLNNERSQIDSKMDIYKSTLEAKISTRDEEIAKLKEKNDKLEEERLKGVPLDTAKEIKNLQNKIAMLEQEKSSNTVAQASVAAQLSDLTRKLKLSEESVESEKAKQKELEERLKVARKEKDEAVRDLTKLLSRKEPGRPTRQKTQVGDGPFGRGDVAVLKRENQELNARIKQLEREATVGGAAMFGAGATVTDKKTQLRHEKILKELEKRYDMERSKNAKLSENLKLKEGEAASLQKGTNKKDAEIGRLSAELAALSLSAKEGVVAAGKVKELEKDNKKLLEENKVLTENFNSERVLRKKYYNMVEDMKGKIRVYCRARPLSSTEKGRGNYSVLKSVDEYTVSVDSQRGLKEFQYDQVFMEDCTQEQIFEDTNNLIQSAVDGYNVCIFAYGQTGSGKTFTMIGDSKRDYPGIAPRAFDRIYEMVDENKSKFDMTITVYMLELYNDKLIDLLAKPGTSDEDKMEIKKDKKGLVFVHGAVVKLAKSSSQLNDIFEEGSKNRHTASTKMNAESSRSHLILSVVLESVNKTTGNALKGKLSLVDLAGSERVGKTGATAEQLKEAMSINKSLSALGDVISALSSEQSFIPYRNNKLTMLMQDSLGGNAKTLMFVNISPADYNVDETVISLTYASRVKLITNDATKNADNKEIARLKAVINKLKKGEQVGDEEI